MSPTRAEVLRTKAPQLVADVTLYPMAAGGKKWAIHLGFGCPCSVSKSTPMIGYDACPLLEEPMSPGDRRRLGFVFLSGEEAAEVFRKACTFYLWDGRFIGEAVVVS